MSSSFNLTSFRFFAEFSASIAVAAVVVVGPVSANPCNWLATGGTTAAVVDFPSIAEAVGEEGTKSSS